jgi:hypothetical protein
MSPEVIALVACTIVVVADIWLSRSVRRVYQDAIDRLTVMLQDSETQREKERERLLDRITVILEKPLPEVPEAPHREPAPNGKTFDPEKMMQVAMNEGWTDDLVRSELEKHGYTSTNLP